MTSGARNKKFHDISILTQVRLAISQIRVRPRPTLKAVRSGSDRQHHLADVRAGLEMGVGGGGFPTGGDAAASHRVHDDDKHVAFSTTDQAPGPGEAHVYRVSATQQGVVFGGYTIVLMG
jgi:hypothetical protein